MKISIIIPAYNAENTIKRCLLSIINQTYNNIEIVVVNDGSTDNTLKILKELSIKYKNIVVYNKKNNGVSSARNKGLEICTGDFITFIDSDDYIDNIFLEEMINLIKISNLDLVACGIKYESKSGKIIKDNTYEKIIAKTKKEIGNNLNKFNKSFVYGKIYKKSIIERNNIKFNENISLGEDTLFVMEYLYFIENGIAILNKSLYHYVDANIDSLSKKYHSDIKEIYEKIYNLNNKLSEKYSAYKIPYKKECLVFTMDIKNMYLPSSPLTKKERLEEISNYMNDYETRKAFSEMRSLNKIDILNKFLILFKLPRVMDFIYRVIYRVI